MKVESEIKRHAGLCTRIVASLVLATACFACLAAFAQETTNSTLPKARTASNQVWDYSDQLGFTAEQSQKIQAVKTEYESARKELEGNTSSNIPPDLMRISRQQYAAKVRKLGDEISDILTDAQKAKLKEIRKAARAARVSPASTNSVVSGATNSPALVSNGKTPSGGEADNSPGELATNSPGRTVHPELSDAELKKLAEELRKTYSKPSSQWPAPNIDDEVKPRYVELGLLPPVAYPSNNLYSDAKSDLGKKLFFDPRLSESGQIACASCHDPDLNWADGRTVAFGHGRKVLPRNAPSLLNAGQLHSVFWDGRAGSLEEQAVAVINNEDEMRGSEELIVARLSKIPAYTNEFNTVYGSAEISMERVKKAVATFERTITSRRNSFDDFLRGDDEALNDSAIRGLHLFRTAARCANCHNGPNFTDGLFHNEGLTYYGRKYEDLGRYKVTTNPDDVGRFKTPSLRNVANTAPYMHNGLFDLDGVLGMYNAGMANPKPGAKQKDDPLFPKKSPLLKPLGLNKQEIADLKAFLESLSETRFHVRPPELPQEVAGGI